MRAICAREPELATLLGRPEGVPTLESARLRVARGAPLTLIKIRLSGRGGTLWVSRLPGSAERDADSDVRALRDFGIQRVFCLSPRSSLVSLHGAQSYLSEAATQFGSRFHLVDVPDHDVPREPEAFDEFVREADAALLDGQSILVHCVGGCGRTGIFCACLMVRRGLGAREAIESFRAQRGCGPETLPQLAYVFRYQRLGEAERATMEESPRLVLTQSSEGGVRQIASRGLNLIQLGRLRWSGGRCRRVAVKRFRTPLDDEGAEQLRRQIQRLRQAGVQLPRMHVVQLADGCWAQVTPLFGGTNSGSRLHQPSSYYKSLSTEQQSFAADQLTRVANAGFLPTLDLFLVFKDERLGLLPIDLDLVTAEPSADKRAHELIKRLVLLGQDREQREHLLAAAERVASTELRPLLRPLTEDPRQSLHRPWCFLQ